MYYINDDFEFFTWIFDFSFLNISRCQKQINTIVFLLSITKHSLWTHRNQIVQKGIAFCSKK